jgi:hypothetical protein
MVTEKCECCGEGKDPLDVMLEEDDLFAASPVWQCRDCEQWNGEVSEVLRSYWDVWDDRQRHFALYHERNHERMRYLMRRTDDALQDSNP